MVLLKRFFFSSLMLFSLVGGYFFLVLPSQIVPMLQDFIAEKTDFQFSANSNSTNFTFSLTPLIEINHINLVRGDKEIKIKQAVFEFDVKKWVQNYFSLRNIPINKVTFFEIRGENISFPELTITQNTPSFYDIKANGIYNSAEYNLSGFFKNDLTFSFDLNGDRIKANLTGKYENQQIASILKATITDLPYQTSTSVAAEIAGPIKNLSVPTFQTITTYQYKHVMTINGDIKSFTPLDANISFGGYHDIYKAFGSLSINDKLFNLSQLKLDLKYTHIETADVKIDLTSIPEIKATVLADTLNINEITGTVYSIQQTIKKIFGEKSGKIIATENKKSTNPEAKTSTEKTHPLNIPAFKAANGDIIIHANKLISNNGKDIGSAEIKAELKDGVLNVPAFNIGNFIRGTLNAKTLGDTYITAKTRILVKSLPLHMLNKHISSGTVSGVIDLETKTDSQEGLIGRLIGSIKLASKKIVFTPKIKALKKIFGSRSLKEISLNCAVINTPVHYGMMLSEKNIAFETDKQQIVLNGTIDLKNKLIDTTLIIDQDESEVSLGTILSKIFISGPFSNVNFRVDRQDVIDNLAAMGFQFFHPDMPFAHKQVLKNVCQKALEQ
ncbi:MAG: hypothetical protein MJ250_07885 [Alphaproteobacteria bacterium]|nr:hypothetical protein [Alphaproteobacteria bacterium]